MFDIGAAELLVIIIVAVVVIGPKDLPLAMRVAGRWIGKIRRISSHFRSGIDTMVREAELEDMEKKWKAQNEEIMRRSSALTEAEAGTPLMTGPPPVPSVDPVAMDKPLGDTSTSDAAPTTSPSPLPAPPPPLPLPPPLNPVPGPMPSARLAVVEVGGDANALDPAPNAEPFTPAMPHEDPKSGSADV